MRYQSSEATHAVATFEPSRTVNVVVLNIATDAALPTTAGTATESAQQAGVYIWPISDLVTPLSAYTQILVRFTDATSGLVKYTKLVVHGYVESVDATVTSRASQASLDALQDLSIADVQTALTNQGYTSVRAALLDNLDAAISALNDISIADILTAALTSGDTVDDALSRLDNIDSDASGIDTTLTALDELIRGGRDIDFVGNDVLGWQRVERDTAGVEVARYNLFDEADARITGTVLAFLAASKMIAKEVKL